MGRFYQTSTPTFVDNKMFQLPYELMGKVLEKKDEAIQSDIDATVALTDTLKAQGLKVDEGRLQEKIGGYQDRIDEQVKNIRGNVLNYDTTGVQKLKRDITTDWTRGEVAAIESNRASYLADLENWKALAKADPEKYTQQYIDKLASASLSGYEGVNYKGPSEYGVYKGMEATAMPDLNKWVEDRLKGAMPDVTSIEREGNSGGWRIKTGTETKIMSEQALNAILDGALRADVNLKAALKQRGELGIEGFGGIFGEDNEIVNPVNFYQDEETKQIGRQYQDNILGSAFNAGLEKFGFSEIKKTVDSKVDSFALQEHAARLKREEEKKKDEFVTMTTKGTVTAYGGDSSVSFKDERTSARTRLAEIGEQGMTLALTQFGYKTAEEFKAKSPDTYAKVVSGDLTGAGVTSEIATTLSKEAKGLKFEESVRSNIVSLYREGNPMPDPTDKKAVIEDNKKFSLFLASRDAPVVDVVKGWGYLPDMTAAKQKQFVNQINDSNHLEAATLNIPKGTKVKNKSGVYVDLSEYGSINEMIKAGIAQVKQVPTGVVTETGEGFTTESGMYIPGATTKIVELMDGTVIGNLTIPSESLVPVFGASDNGNVQLEATLNLAGQTIPAIVNNVSSTSIDKYNEDNATMLAGRKRIAKVGYGSVDLSPNQDGSMIYYGNPKGQKRTGVESEDQTKTYRKGSVVVREEDGTYQTYDMEDDIVEQEIYRRIFE